MTERKKDSALSRVARAQELVDVLSTSLAETSASTQSIEEVTDAIVLGVEVRSTAAEQVRTAAAAITNGIEETAVSAEELSRSQREVTPRRDDRPGAEDPAPPHRRGVGPTVRPTQPPREPRSPRRVTLEEVAQGVGPCPELRISGGERGAPRHSTEHRHRERGATVGSRPHRRSKRSPPPPSRFGRDARTSEAHSSGPDRGGDHRGRAESSVV